MLIVQEWQIGYSDWHTNCFTTSQHSAVSEAIVGANQGSASLDFDLPENLRPN